MLTMKKRHWWMVAGYCVIILIVLLKNLETKTIITPLASKAAIGMKGDNIPAAYLAALPEVQDNGGKIPEFIATADVSPHVMELHRGWPMYYQNEYGYHYEIVNPAAGFSSTLSDFPKHQGISFLRLLLNTVGVLSVAFILLLSAEFFTHE